MKLFLNLDQWFRRKCCFKVYFIRISGSLFAQQSVIICAILVEGIYLEFWQPSCLVELTIYAILKEGIMGYIHAKFYEPRTSGSGEDVV